MIKLKDLLRQSGITYKLTRGDLEQECHIQSLTMDSRAVGSGALFIASKGTAVDSHKFLSQVCTHPLAALIVEETSQVPDSFTGPVLQVSHSRRWISRLAAVFYHNPGDKLFVAGVTGTNGKTSITYFLECLFSAAKIPTAVVGTVNHHLGEQVWPSEMTTPDPILLQSRLNEMQNAGAQALAIEVSSHALDQFRVEGINFDVAIFTNLTRDHLDYHQTMENYFLAKLRFFSQLLMNSSKQRPTAVINIDDEYGLKISSVYKGSQITYGQGRGDVQFKVQKMDFISSHFQVEYLNQSVDVQMPMSGLHNIYNACAAMATGLVQGLSLQQMSLALVNFSGVPGRLQPAENSRGLAVFVDYAHSPDALENVLLSLRKIRGETSKVKIWTVFGCGGDRDKGKRPLMAQMAEEYSDFVMITSDNPRTEDPGQIISDIKAGLKHPQKVQVEVDRKLAIEKVLSQAQTGDVVLIAGKGHEDYQIIGTTKYPFSDAQVVKEYQ